MSEQETTNWRKIPIKGVIGILLYYFILFFLGLIIFFYITFFPFTKDIIKLSLIGSVAMSLLGSSIYYIRKLYKLCIQNKINPPDCCKTDIYQEIGSITYFVTRPLFSIVYATLIVLGLKAGIFFTVVKNTNLDEGFMYLSMVIAFYAGFSSGNFLKQLEGTAEMMIKKVFDGGDKK